MSKLHPFLMAMALSNLFMENSTRSQPKSDPLDKIDLDAEYKLIQLKESKLSANQRRRVVYLVESRDLADGAVKVVDTLG